MLGNRKVSIKSHVPMEKSILVHLKEHANK
jgi:hypothetical protein